MALTLTSVQQPPPEFSAEDSCGLAPPHVNDFLVARGWINQGHIQQPAWKKDHSITSDSTWETELDTYATFTWMEALTWEMYRTLFMAKGPGE